MTNRPQPRRDTLRFFLPAFFLLFALPLPALAIDWFTVEVLVFAERSDAGLGEESWSASPGQPDLSGALEPGSGGEFEWLSESRLELAPVARQLDRSGRYRTLLLRGWHQPGYGPRGALPVHLRSDASISLISPADSGLGIFTRSSAERQAVEGVIRVHRSRYLHVLVDLLYARPDAQVGVNDGTPSPPSVYRLTSTRRMRSREMHYYDHPLFGVLVKITPYGTQQEAEPAGDPTAAEEDDSEQPPSGD